MREALVKQLRSALSQFDVDVSQYSGHSFRIGAVTTAAAVGLEDSQHCSHLAEIVSGCSQKNKDTLPKRVSL